MAGVWTGKYPQLELHSHTLLVRSGELWPGPLIPSHAGPGLPFRVVELQQEGTSKHLAWMTQTGVRKFQQTGNASGKWVLEEVLWMPRAFLNTISFHPITMGRPGLIVLTL